MAYNYQKLERVPVDSKIVDKISRSPKMSSEQGIGFLSSYGGHGRYMTFAKLPGKQRMAYAAVLEGHTEPDEISVVTGMNRADVSVALASLEKRGLIDNSDGFTAR